MALLAGGGSLDDCGHCGSGGEAGVRPADSQPRGGYGYPKCWQLEGAEKRFSELFRWWLSLICVSFKGRTFLILNYN